MKRISVVLLLAVAALVAVSSLKAAPPLFGGSGDEVQWQTSLQAAHQLAVAQNKPIMIVFGADWCGYCKKLEKQTLAAPDVARYINQHFVPVHLDLDKEQRIGQILEVQSLPCTVIVNANAELVGRIEGYYTPGPFQEKLTSARQQFQQVQATAPAGGVTR